MAETVHTTTKTFNKITGEHLVSFDVGAGSVVVACEHGSGNWIDFETITADAVKLINFGSGSRTIRFTVAGGATYAL